MRVEQEYKTAPIRGIANGLLIVGVGAALLLALAAVVKGALS